MRLENVQNRSKNYQKQPKNVGNLAKEPKNIQKVRKLLQKPTHNKKSETCPQNPTAGPKTYWAPRAYSTWHISGASWSAL